MSILLIDATGNIIGLTDGDDYILHNMQMSNPSCRVIRHSYSGTIAGKLLNEQDEVVDDPTFVAPPELIPPTPTEVIINEIKTSTQKRLDDWAKTKGYDGILSACTYATSTIQAFAAEGQRAVVMRDATWAMLYTIMDEVTAGTRAMPTGYKDVESALPALTW